MRILITDKLKEWILDEHWPIVMYELIGNVYDVADASKDRYYVIKDDRRWSIPKECVEIINENPGRIRWYKNGKLEEKLITKFEIFENTYTDLDPYNEERWDDRKDIDILRDIAVKLHLNPTEIQGDTDTDAEYFDFNVDYPHRWILNFSVSCGYGTTFICLQYPIIHNPSKQLFDLTEKEFVDVYTDIAEKLKSQYA